MHLVAIATVALVALAFAAVNGVLICVSPRQPAAFWPWYTRAGEVSLRPIDTWPNLSISMSLSFLIDAKKRFSRSPLNG